MIKKALSFLMTFTCLFSAGTPVFAGGDEYLPTQYCKKHQIPTKSSQSQGNNLFKKRRIAQKAFLTGLLLATGADIEIAFRKIFKDKSSLTDFMVKKINNIDVKFSRSSSLQDNEIAALLDALKNENFKFEFNSRSPKQLTILSAKIHDHFLSQGTMYKMGEKVLELIMEKRPDVRARIPMSLNNDIELRNKILNIFNGLHKNNSTENTLKFFGLTSDSRNPEPVTNPDHVDYLKQHPDATSHLIVCYQKMFFIGLLCAFGIKVKIKLKETPDGSFPECMVIHHVDQHKINRKKEYYGFLENMIKHINSSFPPEKLKIETSPLSYSMPSKVTINNQIILNETDIFNLGQRFYNLIYKIAHEYLIQLFRNCTGFIDLNEVTQFTLGVQAIFKDYTGKDLPYIK